MNEPIVILSEKGTQKISVKSTGFGISILVIDVKKGSSNTIHVFNECALDLAKAIKNIMEKQP